MAEIESYVNFERSLLPLALMDELISQNRARDYQENEPFPHTVIDNFFDPSIVDRVLSEFPSARDIDWEEYDSFEEVKLATGSELQIKSFTRYLIYSLNSSTFINFLETLTGISGLIADPHLSGGGLHQIMPGGKLGMHVDFKVIKPLVGERCDIRGKVSLQTAAGSERITFTKLSKARGAARRRGGVTVTLRDVRFRETAPGVHSARVRVAVTYATGPRARRTRAPVRWCRMPSSSCSWLTTKT